MSAIPRLATGDIHPSMRLAAVVDVETTGFSPQNDAVIEAAITLFAFHRTEYQVLGIVDEYVGLQATDIPSSPRALAVHRITEADTFGQAIDRSRLSAMIDRAELMIAHNASFDRAFLRQLVAHQVDSKPWLCAMRGIDWPGYGHESRRLGRLLRAHGIIPTVEHRAGGDVTGTLQLLAMTNASSPDVLVGPGGAEDGARKAKDSSAGKANCGASDGRSTAGPNHVDAYNSGRCLRSVRCHVQGTADGQQRRSGSDGQQHHVRRSVGRRGQDPGGGYRYGSRGAWVSIGDEGGTVIINERTPSLQSEVAAGLKIYGAAYGLKDVTSEVRRLVRRGSLNVTANTRIFGDPWPDHAKSLVVVYEQDGKPTLRAVKQNEPLHIQIGVPLKVLAAAYGPENVTDKVSARIDDNEEIHLTANDTTFFNSWPSVKKTLVVTYQYGNDQPQMAIIKEGDTLNVTYTPHSPFHPATDPQQLQILSGAYGRGDVTARVAGLVQDNALNVMANNKTFPDTWQNVPKTLVVTYQFGQGTPAMTYARIGERLQIKQTM